MERVRNAQSRRFEDQRCNPPQLSEINNSNRQTDSLHNSKLSG